MGLVGHSQTILFKDCNEQWEMETTYIVHSGNGYIYNICTM